MLENNENFSSQFPKTQDDIVKCLVLSDQPSQTHSIYCQKTRNKTTNIHILENWNHSILSIFAWKKSWLLKWLSELFLISFDHLIDFSSIDCIFLYLWVVCSTSAVLLWWDSMQRETAERNKGYGMEKLMAGAFAHCTVEDAPVLCPCL